MGKKQHYKNETFSERITRTEILKRKVKDRKEESVLCAFQQSLHPDDIINSVAAYFKISREDILRRRSKEKLPRQVAMYLCTIYCTSRVSMSDFGKLFSVSLSGVSIARDRVKKKIEKGTDKEFIKVVNDIKKSTVYV